MKFHNRMGRSVKIKERPHQAGSLDQVGCYLLQPERAGQKLLCFNRRRQLTYFRAEAPIAQRAGLSHGG